MKKVIISLLLLAVSTLTFAQLKVNSDGAVRMASNTGSLVKCMLQIGDSTTFDNNTKYGFVSSIMGKISNYGVSVKGAATSSSTSDFPYTRIGVWGDAGGGFGRSYGIVGQLSGTREGAGVYGLLHDGGIIPLFSGQYAGYFDGETRVVGDFTATNVYTSSDIRLKENISDIDEGVTDKTLDKLMDVNVIKYNLKKEAFGYNENDKREIKGDATSLVHFGVSAQELQELYPNLVKEGQDGYLSVNYSELVPVLIRSIQELKQELDEVKAYGDSRLTRSDFNNGDVSNPSTKNVLYQNNPNPFKEKTTIRFHLNDDAKDAAICIFDMTGKMLKKLPISSGSNSVSVNGWELGEGMFLYSLIVNGREIDTKRMIITK